LIMGVSVTVYLSPKINPQRLPAHAPPPARTQTSWARNWDSSNCRRIPHVIYSSWRAISPSDRRGPYLDGRGRRTERRFDAVGAIDDPSRIRRSRDIGAYLGLVPRRHQSGEVDYIGSISKCGDRRIRTLLYEAANVMLTRHKGQLKLKDWAFAIARRSTMRKARVALARRLAIIMHAMLRDGTEFVLT
jgi:hypothetical protein